MASDPEASNNHEDDVRTSLDSIIAISSGWLSFLNRRRKRVRLAQAFLTATLIWVGSVAAVLAIVLEQGSLTFFPTHPETSFIILASLLSLGAVGGVAAYAIFGRKDNPKLRELSDLVASSKARREQGAESEGTVTQGATGSALLETEKILELLPQLVRTRNQDSLLFGLVAFVIATILARPPIGILVGVIVWLYFRYETNRTYDRQLSKIEEQKRIFEQRKEEFLRDL